MNVCTYERTYVCMYVRRQVCTCMYACMYACVYVHVYTYIHTHTHTHTHIYIYIQIYIHIYIYICTHIIILYIYIYIHTSARYVDTYYGLHASFSLSSLVHFFFHAPFYPETERERERERERGERVCSGRRRTHRRLFSLFSSGRRVMHDVQATGCASSVHSAINYVYMIPHFTTSTASTSCLHTAQRQRKLARR